MNEAAVPVPFIPLKKLIFLPPIKPRILIAGVDDKLKILNASRILIPGVNNKEILTMTEWLFRLGNYLSTNPTDEEFREMMNRKNPNGLWTNRPEELSILDLVNQVWPHHESVGFHTYSVVQKLDTRAPLNGINYFNSSRTGMIKALRAAAIFHDIAKGKDIGDHKHPQHSADMVESYLKIMKFTPAETWLCHFLIRFHDIIGKTVNRNEKEEVGFIADICHGYPAILQCLKAITIADVSSIPGISIVVGHDVLPEINSAVKLAYEEIMRRNARKDRRSVNLPSVYSFKNPPKNKF